MFGVAYSVILCLNILTIQSSLSLTAFLNYFFVSIFLLLSITYVHGRNLENVDNQREQTTYSPVISNNF